MRAMPKQNVRPVPASGPSRVRRGYFECRYGQLHLHTAMPSGGGFEEGTPLLCVQDFQGSARSFANLLALAGRDRSVYAPDLPGFGESDPPPQPVALADYALALGDFIDTMRLRTLAVLAVGRGGMVAVELALARPAQIARLMLLAVPALDTAARRSAPTAPAAPESQAWAAQAALAYPMRERLAKLTQPLVVVRGQDEPPEGAARVRDCLPKATRLDLRQPAAELFVVPQLLADAVRDFLHAT
jgi:pimeloyl-ACP methyl ester carboxylesterase